MIVSVGRFNYGGHCKNQHVILRVFKKLISERPGLEDWKLRLMVVLTMQTVIQRITMRMYSRCLMAILRLVTCQMSIHSLFWILTVLRLYVTQLVFSQTVMKILKKLSILGFLYSKLSKKRM